MKQDPQQQAAVRKPTILMLLTNAYDPDPRVRQEALALMGMGCRVRMLAWDRDQKSPANENIEGVEVERVFLASKHGRGTTQLFFYALLYLRMLWRGWRTSFDAVHCHDLDTLPLGFALGKLKRKPVVYDAHESFPDMLEGSVPPAVQRVLVTLENFLIRRVDLLITVGEKLRRFFEERGARRSVVVGNWKRLNEFAAAQQTREETRQKLGIPRDALTVVCITQLLKDRKLGELLDAVDATEGVYAIVGGKGILEATIVERAVRNSRILFTGFVRGSEIAALTCAADVVYYGFDPENPNARFSAPNKLFEALAAGRPLITGNFGEIAAVVQQASCGIVLSEYSAEAIADAFAVLRYVSVRSAMAQNASEAGRAAYNWEHAESVLYREYSALLPCAAGALSRASGGANIPGVVEAGTR